MLISDIHFGWSLWEIMSCVKSLLEKKNSHSLSTSLVIKFNEWTACSSSPTHLLNPQVCKSWTLYWMLIKILFVKYQHGHGIFRLECVLGGTEDIGQYCATKSCRLYLVNCCDTSLCVFVDFYLNILVREHTDSPSLSSVAMKQNLEQPNFTVSD